MQCWARPPGAECGLGRWGFEVSGSRWHLALVSGAGAVLTCSELLLSTPLVQVCGMFLVIPGRKKGSGKAMGPQEPAPPPCLSAPRTGLVLMHP